MSEIRSLCHVCGLVANHACKLCGRPVCDSHFDKKTGMCIAHTAGSDMRHARS